MIKLSVTWYRSIYQSYQEIIHLRKVSKLHFKAIKLWKWKACDLSKAHCGSWRDNASLDEPRQGETHADVKHVTAQCIRHRHVSLTWCSKENMHWEYNSAIYVVKSTYKPVNTQRPQVARSLCKGVIHKVPTHDWGGGGGCLSQCVR